MNACDCKAPAVASYRGRDYCEACLRNELTIELEPKVILGYVGGRGHSRQHIHIIKDPGEIIDYPEDRPTKERETTLAISICGLSSLDNHTRGYIFAGKVSDHPYATCGNCLRALLVRPPPVLPEVPEVLL